MLDSLFILADSDDVNWSKLIPIGVIVVFAAISAIASAVRKAGGGRAASQAPPAVPGLPIGPTTPPAYGIYGSPPNRVPAYAVPRAVAPAVVPPPLPPAKRRRSKLAPPPLPPQPQRAVRRVAESADFPEAIGRRLAAGRQTGAGEVVRPRFTPAALRSAIVMTEVFDPPPALRDGEVT